MVETKENEDSASGTATLAGRVREQILHDLAESHYPAGHRYTTEGQLARSLSVSRNTIRKSIDQLEREGHLHRRRRVGILVGPREDDQPDDVSSGRSARQRVVVVLPQWDDSTGGRYSGPLLRALSSPYLNPPLAVEIRHHDDQQLSPDEVILAIDPRGRQVAQLQALAARGGRVLLSSAGQYFDDFIAVDTDRRAATADAVKRLYALGHRHVGLINHDVSHLGFSNAYLGFLEAHRDLGRSIHSRALVQNTFHNQNDNPEINVREVTAWICTYKAAVDLVGNACAEANLQCPRDVSVVTLDDPGDGVAASLGRAVTAYGSNFEAEAVVIHQLIGQWPQQRLGSIVWVPSLWVERGSIAAPTSI